VDAAAVPIALGQFVASGLVRIGEVHHALARHRGRGRAGATALVAALEAFALGDKAPDSVLEVHMANLCRRHGLPALEFHALVCGWEVDFLVPGTRVIIETDGWSTHGLDREQFELDRRKDAHLRSNGYTVLRFTWTQVTKSPEWVAATIRSAIASDRRLHPHELGRIRAGNADEVARERWGVSA
jgi:very-short-patch-repair endonuclease